jgi:gliding motility-associated-like protein
MRSTLRIYLLVLTLMLACINLHGQITSTFNANAEGWTTPNDADATITYSATGGNPGGLVAGSPFVINLGAGSIYVPFNFVAPIAYRGNRSAYYNGTLRYDIQQSSTGIPNQYAEVTIANSGGVTLYYFPSSPNQPPAAPGWATYSVSLNNASGFWKTTNSAAGLAATEIQLQNILTDLAALEIRGLYRDANTTNRLDNVSMRPPIVITTQPTSSTICNGVTTTLTTAATGNPTITYQWQRETTPLVWTNVTNTGGYSGATTATLSVNTTGNFGAGNYRCLVSGLAVNDAITSTAIITINPLPAAPTTTGNSRCGNGIVTLNAAGGTAGQYRWYTVATGGTAIAGQTNAGYTTPALTVTTNYYVAINNGICEGARTIVTATINPIPTAPTTTGNSRCGNGAVTLNAAGGTAGQYRWYTVATGGTAIAGQTNASYTTPALTVTTNYYVSIDNGACEGARTIVTATINPIPAAPTTTGSNRCGNGTVTLNAGGGTAGQYRWYTVATGGTAIAGQTNAAYTTPALTVTTNYYVAINNGICEGARTIVTATINPIPAAPTTTGNSRCGNGIVTLNAAGGTAGQYRWYTVATGGTAIAGQTNTAYTTPSLTGTTNYYVALNNGACEGARTIVTATIDPIPTAPTTTGNSRCGNGAVTLNAAGGTAGQYRWYTVATGGTAIAGQTNAAYTTPSLTGTTNYFVSIDNGTCEGARTIVTATINPIPAAPTTTGNGSCVAASLTLNAAGGTAGQYRWYTVATGGTAIAGQTNSAYATPIISTTTTYYVSINNGTCESTRTPVIAAINTTPIAPTTTGGSSCGTGVITLNATGGTAGQYRWYTVATGGTAIAGQTNAAYTTPSLTGTTNYYVAINNGICEGARTIVTATIDPIPAAPTTTGSSRCGNGTVTLSAAGGTAGQYRWYTVATGGTAIAGQTNAAYTTPSLTGTTNYFVAINNGTCESGRTSLIATIHSIPNAPTASGNSLCGPVSFTLNASGGTAGQYRWYTAATGGSPITGETNSSFTTPVISTTTNYYVSIDNGICESIRTTVTASVLTTGCNTTPPTIDSVPLTTIIEGKITLDLVPLITAPGTLNVSSIKIIKQPSSGAFAEVSNGILTINYLGNPFSGKDLLTIEACDIGNLCSEQDFLIEVAGDVNVYNGMSPNGDQKNEIFFLQYLGAIPDTEKNQVSIYNRWGSKVFEVSDYNNTTHVFKGLADNGEELPSGTYFYKIVYTTTGKSKTGIYN